MKRPWWTFSWIDVAVITVFLLIWYAILGPPQGWNWLTVPPSVMLGKWIGTRFRQ